LQPDKIPRTYGPFSSVPNFADSSVTPYNAPASVLSNIAVLDKAFGITDKPMSLNGSAMDSCDAKWYGDFSDTPGANNASSSQVHSNISLVPSSSEPSSNIIPPSTTRGSRVLGKMDSEQALDLYLQGFSPGQGGAEDST